MRCTRPFLPLLAACTLPVTALAGRALEPDDWYRFRPVSEVQLAPDGASVAYLVTRYDRDADDSIAELWSVPWAGGEPLQLTRGESVSEPRFSPDGRYLSFLSARPAEGPGQLWLLDRRGGEPRAVSHVNQEITDYAWSGDGVHVALVMRAAAAGEKGAKPKPVVIDAFQFKQDKTGYLTAGMRTHLYLLDVRSGECLPLTADAARQDSLPVFAPDGRTLAFVGNRVGTAAEVGRDDIYLMEARAGAEPRRLAGVYSPNHQGLAFTPDGRQLLLLEGDAPRVNAYITDALALADLAGGALRRLGRTLDRAVVNPRLSADGRSVLFAAEDDGYQYPAALDIATDRVQVLAAHTVAHELQTARGHTALLASSDARPPEVYALEAGELRPLTHHNDEFFRGITLGSVSDVRFTSGGTEVHGQLVKPPDYAPGKRYPTILWIHGGPNGQDDHSLELWGYGPPLERQYFATHGYVVLAINYRGGTGRGAAYARSILADWGHREVEDLRAGVDWAIAQGIADPQRLGVGGWSYGGILTDYTIASDARFRAAISGAGSANQTAMYGVDEYVIQYNAELGPPWKDPALWLKLSYPFFHADRIRTPTLFLGGDKDFNVPLAGGEQMYQALRTLGVPAELVIYPGEYHVLTRPSFLVDRSRRYLEWMDRYLKGAP